MLIIIKFGEVLLLISLRIINILRSYIKHSKNSFIRHPNTPKLVKKYSAAPRFFNPLLSVWISDETFFLVFDVLLLFKCFFVLFCLFVCTFWSAIATRESCHVISLETNLAIVLSVIGYNFSSMSPTNQKQNRSQSWLALGLKWSAGLVNGQQCYVGFGFTSLLWRVRFFQLLTYVKKTTHTSSLGLHSKLI